MQQAKESNSKYWILVGLFILINVFIILYFVIFGYRGFLEGAPGWILMTVGAPTTFLIFPLYRFIPFVFFKFSEYIYISLFFQLQYQPILYFLFQIKLKTRFLKIVIFILIVIIIYFSIKQMRIIMLPSLSELEESFRLKNMLLGR